MYSFQSNSILSRSLILLWSFLCLLLFSSQADAYWVLKQYHIERMAKSGIVAHDNESRIVRKYWGLDYDNPQEFVIKEVRPADHTVQFYARLSLYGSKTNPPLDGEAQYSLTVTPEFEWVGAGEPTAEFFYRELCRVELSRSHYSDTRRYYLPADGKHSETCQAYHGEHFQYEQTNPWGVQLSHNNHTSPHGGIITSPDLQYDWCVTYKADKVKATGKKAFGTTRSFSGKISGAGIKGDSGDASIGIIYNAEMCQFDLGVSGDLFADYTAHPRDRHLGGYASKNWTGKDNTASPTEFFWDGVAGYTTHLSPNLYGTIGTAKYDWEVTNKTPLTSGDITYGRDATLWPNEIGNRAALNVPQEEWSWSDTSSKSFHHDLNNFSAPSGSGSQSWPETTVTKVKITGSNPQKSTLTAKAKIDWYPRPQTRVRTQTYVVVTDYDADGEHKEYASIEAALGENGEQQQIDAYIAEIQGVYKQTVDTGITAVGTGLEVYMAVGSWYVPDETDGVLFVVGGAAKKVFKIGRGAIKFGQIVSNLTPKLQSAADAIHTAVKARTGHENVVVEVRQRLIAEGRTGKVPNDGILSKDLPPTDARHIQDKEGVIDDRPVCRAGSRACFVKGTLISTEGGLRAIETLKAGELVWSRNDTTGHTELKPIVQTFERQSSTLLLTFSNGEKVEKVETTKEHPFYVESDGFKAAGQLGIGTSIVTRAGPSVTLVSLEEKSQSQTVYNFEVRDFHTYFVGNSALWVHNVCITDSVWKLNPTERGNLIEDWLAETVYKESDDWFRVGATHSGFFPLIDFQKGLDVVSVKSLNPASSTAVNRMQDHIDDLGDSAITIGGTLANKILDIRIPRGSVNDISSLVAYGSARGVTVRISTAP